jgi:hypothetical protein
VLSALAIGQGIAARATRSAGDVVADLRSTARPIPSTRALVRR